MKARIRGLPHQGIDGYPVGVVAQPGRDVVTQPFPSTDGRRRENHQSVEAECLVRRIHRAEAYLKAA